MRKLLAAVFILGVPAWASYQPITGSSVTVYTTQGGALSVTATNTSFSATGSTITVVPPQGGTMPISGSISNTSFLTTGSTITVVPVQNTLFPVTVQQSTVGVIGAGGVFNVTGSTVGIVGSFSATGSSVTVFSTQGGYLFTNVQASTVGVIGVGGIYSTSGSTVTVIPQQNTLFPVTVQQSTMGVLNVAGTANIGTVTGSTITVVPVQNTLFPVTIQQSTMGVLNVAGTANIGTVTGSSVTVFSTQQGALFTQGTLSDNGAAAGATHVAVVPGIYQTTYVNGTAATQGRDATLSIGNDGLLWTAPLPTLRPFSFTASTMTLPAPASARYIAAVCGNATNTVLVYGVRVACTQTTAGIINMSVVKTTSPFSGFFGTMTVTNDDSNYTTRISSAITFVVNPTNPMLDDTAFNLDTAKLGCMATGTASPNDIYVSPSGWRMKPKVLRGAAQCVAIGLNNTTITGGSFAVGFDWMEITTINE